MPNVEISVCRCLDKVIWPIFRCMYVGTGRDCFWFKFEIRAEIKSTPRLTTALVGGGGDCPKSHLPTMTRGTHEGLVQESPVSS